MNESNKANGIFISNPWHRQRIVEALRAEDPSELFQEADQVRIREMGNEVHLRAIIEFSNYCNRDCLYCGLRKSNQALSRYRMPIPEIVETGVQAVLRGCPTLVLQSGEDEAYGIHDLCALVTRIKSRVDCAITLSVGERSFQDYRMLREAGADRYLLKFETSNPALFQKLKPDSFLEDRLQCLHWLKELGYQVGSGCMVGLPEQTIEDLADDLLFIQKMDFDMVGIGPFISNPETPLKDAKIGTAEMTLRMVALTRILTRNAHLPATTALGSIDPFGRQKGLQCGANVIMPNSTPAQYRALYKIYPNKICLTESPADCSGCVQGMILALGRRVAQGPGHSLKNRFRKSK